MWQGRKRYTSHLAYQHARGPLPPKLQPDHLCKVRACVNPDHLDAVTSRENTLRGDGPTAQNARKVRCIRGHRLPPRDPKTEKRLCRLCGAGDRALYHWRHREQIRAQKARYYRQHRARAQEYGRATRSRRAERRRWIRAVPRTRGAG